MMNRQAPFLTWINNNQNQLLWLSKYADKKLHLSLNNQTGVFISKDMLIERIQAGLNTEEIIDFDCKAKRAWKQHQRRNNNKNKYASISLEIDKNIYRNIKQIAQKYDIPFSIATEELLKSGLDLDRGVSEMERKKKHMEALNRKNNKRLMQILPTVKKTPSSIELNKKLTEEAFYRHKAELLIIKLGNVEDVDKLNSDEILRYKNFCEKIGIVPLLDDN